MAVGRVFFSIEDVNLSDTQRATLIAGLKALGINNKARNPAFCNQQRPRRETYPSGKIVEMSYEGLFNTDNLRPQAIKNRLGDIFEINPDTIDHRISNNFNYGAEGIFSRNSTDYLKFRLFGDGTLGTSYKDSCQAFLDYLHDFAEAWGEGIG